MITRREVRTAIADARKASGQSGRIYVTYSGGKLAVWGTDASHDTIMWQNDVIYWFRVMDFRDQKITVNNHSPQEQDFTFTVGEFVELANKWEEEQ